MKSVLFLMVLVAGSAAVAMSVSQGEGVGAPQNDVDPSEIQGVLFVSESANTEDAPEADTASSVSSNPESAPELDPSPDRGTTAPDTTEFAEVDGPQLKDPATATNDIPVGERPGHNPIVETHIVEELEDGTLRLSFNALAGFFGNLRRSVHNPGNRGDRKPRFPRNVPYIADSFFQALFHPVT